MTRSLISCSWVKPEVRIASGMLCCNLEASRDLVTEGRKIKIASKGKGMVGNCVAGGTQRLLGEKKEAGSHVPPHGPKSRRVLEILPLLLSSISLHHPDRQAIVVVTFGIVRCLIKESSYHSFQALGPVFSTAHHLAQTPASDIQHSLYPSRCLHVSNPPRKAQIFVTIRHCSSAQST